MLRLSKLTDYGTVLMTALARSPQDTRNAAELAQATHVSAPTVSKLLKALTREGLLDSIRGANGGYKLARPPQDISMADIIAALEGPIALTECAVHDGQCGLEPYCTVRGNWQRINQAIYEALAGVSLAELVTPLPPMHGRPLPNITIN